MRQDWYIYPAILSYADDGISVEFPDLPGAFTCGNTEAEALREAKDCLALHLSGMEIDGDVIPPPTPLIQIHPGTSQTVTFVEVWMPPYRDPQAEKPVKKTLTIPKWLNDTAEKENVNFSRILQEALKTHLNVTDRSHRD
jgi:predicted RNase H-like HicB family nuclease